MSDTVAAADDDNDHRCLTDSSSGHPQKCANNDDGLESAANEPMTLDIVINNVVCSFNVRCHLDLRRIALNGANVEYRRENGMVTMKIRKPYTTASVWSSGKITCTGATSEEFARIASRKFARVLQKLGFKTHFTNYRVVNVLGTCTMPFAIRITEFSMKNRPTASYEPELHPGVTYRIKEPKATLKIFSTGSITITAPSVSNVQAAVEHIFPLVYEYRKDRLLAVPKAAPRVYANKNRRKTPPSSFHKSNANNAKDDMSDDEEDEFDSLESMESDESWD